jgi:uncharacterized protein (TIGR03435 family)
MERLLLEFCIRASLIVLTTAIVLRVLRIRSAAARHAVWTGVVIAMLALPAWLEWGPKAAVPVLPARGEPAPAVAMNTEAPAPPIVMETAEAPVAKPAVWNWSAVFLGVYLAGAFVLLLRLAIGTIRARRLTSESCAAPVTVGLLRPRIILPASSSDWPREQLDAVLTHEQAHARRRDPLFQWLSLFNRAVFWFHPLAWWLERKLSALAEEACDAAVLERGHDPREYSRYLLELARAVQRAGTRVNVVAMAMPGSYLPQRVKQIIEGVRAPRISRTRLACAVLACAIPAVAFAAGTLDHVPQILPLPFPKWSVPQPPVLLAQTSAPTKEPEAPPKLEFEVASVRAAGPYQRPAGVPDFVAEQLSRVSTVRGGPGTDDPERLTISRMTPRNLLWTAYGVRPDQISGPDWLDSEFFDVSAKIAPGATKEQANTMLQNLLIERFRITLHHETKDDTLAYELSVAKNGSKMKEASQDEAKPDPELPPRKPGDFLQVDHDANGFPIIPRGRTGIVATRDAGGLYSMTCRACSVAEFIQRIVVDLGAASGKGYAIAARIADKTGLSGKYDFHLAYLGGGVVGGALQPPPVDGQDQPGPDIFTALEKQLGLKLEKTKAPLDVLVIDHIERVPTEN